MRLAIGGKSASNIVNHVPLAMNPLSCFAMALRQCCCFCTKRLREKTGFNHVATRCLVVIPGDTAWQWNFFVRCYLVAILCMGVGNT